MEINETDYSGKGNIGQLLSTYRVRQSILLLIDIFCIIITLISTLLYLEGKTINNLSQFTLCILVYVIIQIASFTKMGCYSSLWRYAGDYEVLSIVIASVVGSILAYLAHIVLKFNLPIIYYVISAISIIALSGGSRVIYRVIRRLNIKLSVDGKINRVLLIGAGSAGNIVINEIKQNPQLKKRIVGILDDDVNKVGRKIHNIRILGTSDELELIVKEKKIDEIIIAMANVSKQEKKVIIEKCQKTKCKLKTIPGIYEIIDGKVDIKKIRDVEIEDLLGRDPIKTNLKEISEYIEEKVVLVTGGGGSIGSELCRQIAKFNPKHLIIVDNYENNAYAIQQELIRKYGNKLNLSTIIASIRENIRMEEIFKEYRPEVVFHAAAHKHVPLMEKSPSEAIKNNVFGTHKVASLADKYGVKRFVLISTDKAVNPTNIMGATKRSAEMIIQSLNERSKTEYVAVRFGNVLGSNGSVIPLFKKQIEEGGPITITHPDIIRYFMTIPEAVGLVIQAGSMAKGGEIFVLDMGEPVKILDLATNLIKLSGFEPGADIKIEFTGLRPGEKLYEELLMSEEGLTNTENEKIFIGQPMEFDQGRLYKHLTVLKKVVDNEEVQMIDSIMREMVETYIRPEEANKKDITKQII